jgi:hypothetical protein
MNIQLIRIDDATIVFERFDATRFLPLANQRKVPNLEHSGVVK